MQASLPMYDRPETAAANDRLWHGVAAGLGIGIPLRREIDDLVAHWLSPDLVFSQTCGFPYRAVLAGKVRLVGTPVLDLDCSPGHYFSVLVMRADDDRAPQNPGLRVAINDPLSQSGWAALHGHLGEPHGDIVQTGAHVSSARAVAEGRADLAAIDALSWSMMRRWDRFTDALRIVATTTPTPTLPYICGLDRDPAPVREALEASIDALSMQDKKTLGIIGLTRLDPQRYSDVPNPPVPMIQSEQNT